MSHFYVNKRKVREATLTFSKLSHRQEDRNKLPVWGLLIIVSLFWDPAYFIILIAAYE